jgi:lipopolysaccharide biosynthesis protein
MKKARTIAFYLPQFFPIPENDEWHGKGFTEWTNVTKAKPMFKGHYQPILPSELGFYDLRVPETRLAQAELAREYGVEAFCYWHYWFGDGKRILERPFKEVLESGQPDFPFCLAWANASWTGIWYGMENSALLEQEYLGEEDDTAHFYLLLDAFKDPRYVRVDDKPLVFIYDPPGHPYMQEFMDLWRKLAEKEGLGGIYFIGALRRNQDLTGFDGIAEIDPFESPRQTKFEKLISLLKCRLFNYPRRIIDYDDVVEYLAQKVLRDNEFPVITPNWDNTARSGTRGSVIVNPSPQKFDLMLKNAIKKIEGRDQDKKIIFVEAWNEWAEGNYLEPDIKFGRGFLEVIKNNIFGDVRGD